MQGKLYFAKQSCKSRRDTTIEHDLYYTKINSSFIFQVNMISEAVKETYKTLF